MQEIEAIQIVMWFPRCKFCLEECKCTVGLLSLLQVCDSECFSSWGGLVKEIEAIHIVM